MLSGIPTRVQFDVRSVFEFSMPGLSARVHHCSGLTQCMLLKALRAQDEAKTEAGGAGIMLSIALVCTLCDLLSCTGLLW